MQMVKETDAADIISHLPTRAVCKLIQRDARQLRQFSNSVSSLKNTARSGSAPLSHMVTIPQKEV